MDVKFNSKDLENRIQNLISSSDKVTEDIAKELGAIVHTSARNSVPVDTGDLKKSITLDVQGKSATVGTPLHYAPYVEYGTSRQSPQPYMRPAAREANKVALDVAKVVLNKYDK